MDTSLKPKVPCATTAIAKGVSLLGIRNDIWIDRIQYITSNLLGQRSCGDVNRKSSMKKSINHYQPGTQNHELCGSEASSFQLERKSSETRDEKMNDNAINDQHQGDQRCRDTAIKQPISRRMSGQKNVAFLKSSGYCNEKGADTQQQPLYFGAPTGDLDPRSVFSDVCQAIRREDRPRFLREFGISGKELSSWQDIPKESAFAAIEEHLQENLAEKIRFWRSCDVKLNTGTRHDLRSCNFDPDENMQVRCIYELLDVISYSRKKLLEEMNIPIPQHPLFVPDLCGTDFRQCLQRWWEKYGQNPELLQFLGSRAKCFVEKMATHSSQ